jgi:hypothetical protein
MALSQAERQVLLFSAGTAARRRDMREEAGGLMGNVDWSRLTEALRFRRLLPALGPRILELARGQASQGFAAAVEQAMEATRRQAIFLQLVSLRAMAALADAGIRSTPLKGPLLGEAIYGDPGRRISNDIDLLVAPEQLHAAVEVVREMDYEAPTDYVGQDGLPLLHFLLLHERGELPSMEIHWRVHWYERSFAPDRLLPPIGSLIRNWRPDPVDELAALLLFYARDGFVDLRLASDLSAWWDAFGTDVHPGALDDLLRAYPALARPISVAVRVAENVVGLPAAQIMEDTSRFGVRDRMAVRLANPNPQASRAQLFAEMGFIDGLLTPRGGFGAFFRRKVLLPREVFDEYAGRASKWGARSPLDYSLRMLARFGLTVIRAGRSSERSA